MVSCMVVFQSYARCSSYRERWVGWCLGYCSSYGERWVGWLLVLECKAVGTLSLPC
jgi:hypothetical protein